MRKKQPPGTPSRRDRVDEICDMMVRNQWRTRITAGELALKWNVARTTIDEYASEASRLLKVPPEQREERRALLAATFEALAHQACTDRSALTGLADPAAAAKIWAEYARFAGLEPPADAAQAAKPMEVEFTFADEDSPKPPADGGDEGSSSG